MLSKKNFLTFLILLIAIPAHATRLSMPGSGSGGSSSGSASGWTDDGTEVRLTGATDDVEIGSAATIAAKFAVNGDSNEIQGLFQAFLGQTADVFVVEKSTGADILAIGTSVTTFSNVSQTQWTGVSEVNFGSGTSVFFEGATDDAFEIYLSPADPTSDVTVTIPAVTGTICTTAAPCSPHGSKVYIQLAVTDPNGDVITVGDGKAYQRINEEITGYVLSAAAAQVTTVSSSGSVSIQVNNVSTGNDVFSTKLSIDQSEIDSTTAAVPVVINTANDDVTAGQQYRIDIDSAGATAKGLMVELTFQKP